MIILGCASKKTTYKYDREKQFDSISFDRKVTIYPSLKDTFYIQSPCDSLSNLKPFSQSYTTSQGNVIIEGKDGHLKATIDLKGFADSTTVKSLVHKLNNSQILQSEVVKYKTDWRVISVLIGSLILNLYMLFRKR